MDTFKKFKDYPLSLMQEVRDNEEEEILTSEYGLFNIGERFIVFANENDCVVSFVLTGYSSVPIYTCIYTDF